MTLFPCTFQGRTAKSIKNALLRNTQMRNFKFSQNYRLFGNYCVPKMTSSSCLWLTSKSLQRQYRGAASATSDFFKMMVSMQWMFQKRENVKLCGRSLLYKAHVLTWVHRFGRKKIFLRSSVVVHWHSIPEKNKRNFVIWVAPTWLVVRVTFGSVKESIVRVNPAVHQCMHACYVRMTRGNDGAHW